MLTNDKSSNTTGCRNKRLFAQNDASWNYKFHFETTPEGMRPYWVKEIETYCGIEYSVKGMLYVYMGGWGVVFPLKTESIAKSM